MTLSSNLEESLSSLFHSHIQATLSFADTSSHYGYVNDRKCMELYSIKLYSIDYVAQNQRNYLSEAYTFPCYPLNHASYTRDLNGEKNLS